LLSLALPLVLVSFDVMELHCGWEEVLVSHMDGNIYVIVVHDCSAREYGFCHW